MFDDVQGLAPEHAARLASLVEGCRALLGHESGMEAVQGLLRDRGTGVVDATAVTRELLGAGPGSLGEAKTVVLTSAARAAELRVHDEIWQVTDVVEAILRRGGDGITIVAVDGAGGSGKTTLAGAVAGELEDCVVVHCDDFYRPMPDQERELLDGEQGYHRYFDWERLRAQVLEPLRVDGAARYQLYDWGTGQLGGWREIAPRGVVIVEGVYSARPALANYYDLTVYVDTPREVCLQRLRDRGQNSDEWINRWRAAEDYYIDTTKPQSRATLVVKSG